MDFEYPNLVTMFVTRDPLSHAMAGDSENLYYYPDIFMHHNATKKEWWRFAKGPGSDNYALAMLSDPTCCQGSRTDRTYLELAKALVERFTFVLDIDCLDEGLAKVADILGFEITHHPADSDSRHEHDPVKERIPYPEVYNYMKQENQLGIELHEWAKSISLVDCSSLEAQP